MRILTVFLVLMQAAYGQSPARVEYEAASIKPGDPNDPSSSGRGRTGGIEMHNTTLANLVRSAYGLNEFQLYGGPKWIDTARFDLVAKFPTGATQEQKPLMMQNLLADRFHLVFHRETRMLPQYDLVVAKGGPKLVASSEDDAKKTRSSQGPRLLRAWGADCAMLARMLVSAVGAPVRDKTGLDGKYNFDLSFAPMQGATPDDDARPSLFAAIQAIGLRLEPTKAQVEVIVIDSANLPDAN